MGLRIIDRHRPAPQAPVSDQEIAAGLAEELSRWPLAQGFGSAEAKRHFQEQVQRVRQRRLSADEVAASAQRVRLSISSGSIGALHGQVDVATLLELL